MVVLPPFMVASNGTIAPVELVNRSSINPSTFELVMLLLSKFLIAWENEMVRLFEVETPVEPFVGANVMVGCAQHLRLTRRSMYSRLFFIVSCYS
jgi:hypothetical protein